ncbi:unnamed protein product [Symbiodinium natans]|uniref:Uncharacterized protein n=1 Tax=Symbiodinium natans TaxID=878477 RepID=A0A812MMU3_9DINO|nr:unnamed protein product [Symbiodinium natans]
MGESPHWHAMEVLSTAQILAAEAGSTLDPEAPRLLAAAARRCPGCAGPLQSLVPALLLRAKDLVQQTFLGEAQEILLQAVSYLHRMVLMGLGGAEALASVTGDMLQEVAAADEHFMRS